MTPLFNIIIYALLPVAAIVLGGITGTVSYTHLDVYKRQQIHRLLV